MAVQDVRGGYTACCLRSVIGVQTERLTLVCVYSRSVRLRHPSLLACRALLAHQPTPFSLTMQVGSARAGLLRGRASAATGRLPAPPDSRTLAGGLRAEARRARQGCILWHNWWPMLTAFFYVLVPMPYLFFGTSPASAHGTSNLASGWARPCGGPLSAASGCCLRRRDSASSACPAVC